MKILKISLSLENEVNIKYSDNSFHTVRIGLPCDGFYLYDSQILMVSSYYNKILWKHSIIKAYSICISESVALVWLVEVCFWCFGEVGSAHTIYNNNSYTGNKNKFILLSKSKTTT